MWNYCDDSSLIWIWIPSSYSDSSAEIAITHSGARKSIRQVPTFTYMV